MDAVRDLSVTTVAVAPSPATSGTTLTVAAGTGDRFPAAPFDAVVCAADAPADPTTAEVVRVTARAGDVLTIVRAQGGSTARTVVAGDVIWQAISAGLLTGLDADVQGRVPASAFTGRGAVLVGTAAGAYAARTVGENGSALLADDAQPDGVRWAPTAQQGVKIDVFDTPGTHTWVKPPGARTVEVVCIGGGGGGGSGGSGGAANQDKTGGAGGAGGSWGRAVLNATLLPATVPVVVGRGGPGAARRLDVGGVPGANGGPSYFGTAPAYYVRGLPGNGGTGGSNTGAGAGGGTAQLSMYPGSNGGANGANAQDSNQGPAGGGGGGGISNTGTVTGAGQGGRPWMWHATQTIPAGTNGTDCPAGSYLPGAGGGGGVAVLGADSGNGGRGGKYGGGGGGGAGAQAGRQSGAGGDGGGGVVVVVTTFDTTSTFSPDWVAGSTVPFGQEATMPRSDIQQPTPTVNGGELILTYFTARYTGPRSQVRVIYEGAGAGLTVCRIGVYAEAPNGDITLLGATVNEPGMFPFSGGVTTRNLAAPVNLIAGNRYAVGIIQIGTTTSRFQGWSRILGDAWRNFISQQTPRVIGARAGQTDLPASLPSGQIAWWTGNNQGAFWAELLT